MLEQRETGQIPSIKKGSINTRDFILSKMNSNGISSIDEKMKGSRFNFGQNQNQEEQKISSYQTYS